MDATWIVSANAGRAKIYSQGKPGEPLEEIEGMVNTAARLRTSETETDNLGQRSASKSRHSVGAPTQPSGYEPEQSPAEHQTELFARNIADFLLKAQQEGQFRQVSLIASPEFLGVLRKQLNPNVTSAVNVEIDKDYTQFSGPQLLEQLRAYTKKA